MPHESSEDSSNQPDGPKGSPRCPPWPPRTPWLPQSIPSDISTGLLASLNSSDHLNCLSSHQIMIWGFLGDNLKDNLGTTWGLPGVDLINLLLGNHIENSGPFANDLVTIGGAYLRPVGSIWLFLSSFEPFIRKGERIARSNLGSGVGAQCCVGDNLKCMEVMPCLIEFCDWLLLTNVIFQRLTRLWGSSEYNLNKAKHVTGSSETEQLCHDVSCTTIYCTLSHLCPRWWYTAFSFRIATARSSGWWLLEAATPRRELCDWLKTSAWSSSSWGISARTITGRRLLRITTRGKHCRGP